MNCRPRSSNLIAALYRTVVSLISFWNLKFHYKKWREVSSTNWMNPIHEHSNELFEKIHAKFPTKFQTEFLTIMQQIIRNISHWRVLISHFLQKYIPKTIFQQSIGNIFVRESFKFQGESCGGFWIYFWSTCQYEKSMQPNLLEDSWVLNA